MSRWIPSHMSPLKDRQHAADSPDQQAARALRVKEGQRRLIDDAVGLGTLSEAQAAELRRRYEL